MNNPSAVFRKTPIALAVAAFAGAVGISAAAPGDSLTGEIPVNVTTTASQVNPAVAMDADRDFVVVWSGVGPGDTSGVFARCFTAAGAPLSAEIPVNTTTTNLQGNPSVAMDSDGDFVVAWESLAQDTDSYGVFARRFDAFCQEKDENEFLVNVTTVSSQGRPSVVMDADGDFVVAWQSNVQDGGDYGVFARRFDISGVPVSGEIAINTTTTSNQRFPAVAADARGGFVVAWESAGGQDGNSYGVFARRFDLNGVSITGEIAINTFTTDSQERPAAAMDSNGDFVVAWHSLGGQDGDSSGVFARRFNADGTAASDEIAVNTTTSNSQNTPAVAMDSDGDFVVAWNAFTQDGDGDAVIARRFEADGTPASGEIQVNTTTTASQNLPAVAMDAGGDFAVVWQSYGGQDGSVEGVFARLFEGAALGCTPAQSECAFFPTGSLSFKNSEKPGKDQFKFKLSGGDTTGTPELFGDPTADTANVLCIYDPNGLLMELFVDAAEVNSKGAPAWKINTKSATRFGNSAGNADGVTKVQQKPGEKAKVSWSAGKENLVIPELPLTVFPLTVQNQISGGDCVGTFLDQEDFTKNDAEKVKAKARIEPD